MKKILITLLVLLVAAFFVLCTPTTDTGDTGNTNDTSDTGNTNDTSDTSDTGDTGETGPLTVDPSYWNLPEDFSTGTPGEMMPSPWIGGYSGGYTDSNGPTVRYPQGEEGNTSLYSLQVGESALGNGSDQFGTNTTGYSYVQVLFETPGPGTFSFDFRSCGWDASANKTTPNGDFDFWLDLDIANIGSATNPDWSRPDQNLYDGSSTSIQMTSGSYRLTWKVTKDFTGLDEDTAYIDNLEFTPNGWEPDVPDKDWLFLMYMDGDCDLEEALWGDVNEMEYGLNQLSSTIRDQITIVVLWDGISGYSSDSPTGTYLYELGPESSENVTLGSNTITKTGWWGSQTTEVNMGSASNITSFLDWADSEYPDYSNVMLMFSNHGGGTRNGADSGLPTKAVCWDESNGDDYLETKELQEAISDSTIGKLSIVGMDACLMAAVEEAYQLRNDADYFVASLESEQGDGWEFNHWIPQMTPSMTPAALGTLLVESYRDNFDTSFGDQTLSCTNLSYMGALKTAIDNLASAIVSNGISESYFSDATVIGASFANQHEIGSFCDELQGTAVDSQADAVITAMDNAIVYAWADYGTGNNDGASHYGLAIVGESNYGGVPYWYSTSYLDFATSSGWKQALNYWY